MPERDFFLTASDVADPRRRAAALKLASGYATGGQRSVHECFLTPAERGELLLNLAAVLDESADRFVLTRLDPRARVSISPHPGLSPRYSPAPIPQNTHGVAQAGLELGILRELF